MQSQARKLMDLLRKPVGTSPRRNGLVPRKAVRGILWVETVEITESRRSRDQSGSVGISRDQWSKACGKFARPEALRLRRCSKVLGP